MAKKHQEKTHGQGLTPIFPIRLRPADREILQAAADRAGVSLGAWLVACGLRAAKRIRTERKAKT